jgi:hypothetical protein
VDAGRRLRRLRPPPGPLGPGRPATGGRRAGLPPRSGPPPSPGGTRTSPPSRASRSAGEVSPTHLGVAPRTFRGVKTVRPTPHRSSSERRYSEVGLGSFDEHSLRDSPRYHAAVLGLSQFRHISWRSCLTAAAPAMIPDPSPGPALRPAAMPQRSASSFSSAVVASRRGSPSNTAGGSRQGDERVPSAAARIARQTLSGASGGSM